MSGIMSMLKLKPGVQYGEDVFKLFSYARERKFAYPAVNVTSTSTVNAVLEAARDAKSPVIIQLSNGGAAFFAGKALPNKQNEASIAGAIAAAHYVRAVAPLYGVPVILHSDHCAKELLPWLDGMLDADEEHYRKNRTPLFSSHMIDLSAEPFDFNLATSAKYLERANNCGGQWLELEIGITGGEEDGVNHEGVENSALFTQPEEIWQIYKTLSSTCKYFSIAAAFGNVHGVYHPGNVTLQPELLGKHQAYVRKELGTSDDLPVFFVFHGGSGSTKAEFKTAISHGVVKVNLDTDLQWAYLCGIRDFILTNKDYLMTQVGNPDGIDKPNKKKYDPRVWVREGEKTMKARVIEALESFKAAGTL